MLRRSRGPARFGRRLLAPRYLHRFLVRWRRGADHIRRLLTPGDRPNQDAAFAGKHNVRSRFKMRTEKDRERRSRSLRTHTYHTSFVSMMQALNAKAEADTAPRFYVSRRLICFHPQRAVSAGSTEPTRSDHLDVPWFLLPPENYTITPRKLLSVPNRAFSIQWKRHA